MEREFGIAANNADAALLTGGEFFERILFYETKPDGFRRQGIELTEVGERVLDGLTECGVQVLLVLRMERADERGGVKAGTDGCGAATVNQHLTHGAGEESVEVATAFHREFPDIDFAVGVVNDDGRGDAAAAVLLPQEGGRGAPEFGIGEPE